MRKFITLILALMMLCSVLLTGCGKVEMINGETYSDQIGTINEITGREDELSYRTDIFYRNDLSFVNADPFAFQCADVTDTENYGKFFLFGTTNVGVFNCFMSDDLVSWERKSGAYAWHDDGWEQADCWAPEVVWDKDADPADYDLVDTDGGQGVYFFFYSASTWVDYYDSRQFQLGLAVATCPYGPYKMWNGVEKGATIAGVDYGTQEAFDSIQQEDIISTGYTHIGREGDKVTNNDPWWNDSAARASLDFQWNNRVNAGEVIDGTYVNEEAAYMVFNEGAGGTKTIDPSPFVDPVTGKKYLYFSFLNHASRGSLIDENNLPLFKGQQTYVVEFVDNDWAQIDYSTLTRCTRGMINIISEAAGEAYQEAANAFDASKYPLGHQEGELNLEVKYADAESRVSATGVNEGPFVIYNKDTGLYYMSVSVGAYTDNTYSLVLLVAYSPRGPWRKLDLEEGGLILSADSGRATDLVTGPGHHSFVQVGDELINVYHKHLDLTVSIHSRGTCIDRMSWVKNKNGLTILHTNGPTTAIQPLIYGTGQTKYDIISDEAEISVKGDDYNDAKYLNDGVIAIHSEDVHPHIHEFETTDDKAVITLKFDDYRTITSVMIYNSRDYEKSFIEIDKIEMKYEKDGKKGTAVINNLQFYWDFYLQESGDAMRPGGSAVAMFEELNVKEIKITVLNPNIGDDLSGVLAISEIYVVGVPNA